MDKEKEIPDENRENTEKEEKIPLSKALTLYLHDIVYLLCAMMVTLVLIFRVVVVSGTSMNMTLLDGDYLLLLSNTFYHTPEQGDIIVVSKNSFDNGAAFVKRVIATEGQTVDIDFTNGIVYVDGAALEEPYINNLTTTQGGVQFPLVVEEGCVFAMGDNRGISKDSRYPDIGQIDTREILGRAIFLMIPGTNKETETLDLSRIGVIK
jgi:signal peptidase I